MFILKRGPDGLYELAHVIQAHNQKINCVTLNNDASTLATVCQVEHKVKLWDVKLGLFASLFEIHLLIHTGTELHSYPFKSPTDALFFNSSPTSPAADAEA